MKKNHEKIQDGKKKYRGIKDRNTKGMKNL